MFIVLEGLDGAGTTTQAELLRATLVGRGQQVLVTREPSDGPLGKLARDMLGRRIVDHRGEPIDRETLALVFAADRLHHCANEILPALRAGHTVISDRYVHSSYVYQGDVDGDDHFDIDWVLAINSRALSADVTFFLEVPVDVALGRLGERAHRDIYETREKLERLAARYDQVMRTLADQGERIVRVDGTLPAELVHDAIMRSRGL